MRDRSFCVHATARAKFLSRRAIALTTGSVDTRLSLRTIGVLLTSALVVDQAVAIVVFLVADLCAWRDRALALAPNAFHALLCPCGTFADSLILRTQETRPLFVGLASTAFVDFAIAVVVQSIAGFIAWFDRPFTSSPYTGFTGLRPRFADADTTKALAAVCQRFKETAARSLITGLL